MKLLRQKERWPIALDIGSDSIKVLQLDEANGGLIARACGQWQFPAVISDPEHRSEMIVTAVREILRRGDFKGRQSVSSLSGSAVDIKNVRLPKVSRQELHCVNPLPTGYWTIALPEMRGTEFSCRVPMTMF